MNGNHNTRLARLESSDDRRPRDICIDVQYYDAVDTADGRKDVSIPADYDPVDWDTIAPQVNGDRITVRFPCSENLGDAKGKSN
jgi:hypothetical protein